MAKYRLQAEPGKFGVEVGVPAPEIQVQGDQVVLGVVAMHNMLMTMARQLEASQLVLMQLLAAADPANNYVETSLNVQELGQLMDINAAILEQIHVK